MLNLLHKYFPESLEGNDHIHTEYSKLDVNGKKRLIEKSAFAMINGVLKFEYNSIVRSLGNFIEDSDHHVHEHLSKYIVDMPMDLNAMENTVLKNDILAHAIVKNSVNISDSDLCKICISNKILVSSLANRKDLSDMLADFVVAHGTLSDVMTILRRKSNALSIATISEILTKFHDLDEAYSLLASRVAKNGSALNKLMKKLPSIPKKKLISHLLDIKTNSIIYYNLDQRAFSFDFDMKEDKAGGLAVEVEQYIHSGSISGFMMLKYICNGDFYSFIYALSKKLDMNFEDTKELVTNKFIFAEFTDHLVKAGLADDMIKAIQGICNLLYESTLEEYVDSKNFKNVLSRRFDLIKHNFNNSSTMHYIMTLINT